MSLDTFIDFSKSKINLTFSYILMMPAEYDTIHSKFDPIYNKIEMIYFNSVMTESSVVLKYSSVVPINSYAD